MPSKSTRPKRTKPLAPIRILPDAEPRVETGVTQFGDDWPGVFVRGDSAIGYAQALHVAAATLRKGDFAEQLAAAQIADLLRLFRESSLLYRRDALSTPSDATDQ